MLTDDYNQWLLKNIKPFDQQTAFKVIQEIGKVKVENN